MNTVRKGMQIRIRMFFLLPLNWLALKKGQGNSRVFKIVVVCLIQVGHTLYIVFVVRGYDYLAMESNMRCIIAWSFDTRPNWYKGVILTLTNYTKVNGQKEILLHRIDIQECGINAAKNVKRGACCCRIATCYIHVFCALLRGRDDFVYNQYQRVYKYWIPFKRDWSTCSSHELSVHWRQS